MRRILTIHTPGTPDDRSPVLRRADAKLDQMYLKWRNDPRRRAKELLQKDRDEF
jgi:hypothetical protein